MKLMMGVKAFTTLLTAALAASQTFAQESDAGPPKFVFTGKVKELQASTEPSVKGSDHTVVVTVEEIQPPVPELLAGYKGQDITVKTTRSLTDAPLAVGQRAVFSTQGLVYGKGLVVREVAERRLISGSTAAVAAGPGLKASPVAEVVGTVEEVHPVAHERVLAAFGKAAPKKVFPREHDPKWHEAVVRVDSAEGEAKGQKHVVVVFPQSDDIAWSRAPKFHKGQRGKFRLHKMQIKNPELRAALLGAPSPESPAEAGAYTALNPNDFTPLP